MVFMLNRTVRFYFAIFTSHYLFGQVIDFEKQVLPIFETHCLECHQKPVIKGGRLMNPKAGLRMDGLVHLMFGSADGPVIVPNYPSKSVLYSRVTLPDRDDDRMPPKGDPLTTDQKDVVRRWIAQGADFGNWEGATDGIDELKSRGVDSSVKVPEFVTFYVNLAKGVQPVDPKIVSSVARKSGLLIRPIGINSPLLEARVVTEFSKVSDESLDALQSLSSVLVRLDLHATSISSDGCRILSEFENLTELNLRGCNIDDAAFENIMSLPKLQSLNLGQTGVSSESLFNTRHLPNLEKLNVWKTQISKSDIVRYKEENPQLIIVH